MIARSLSLRGLAPMLRMAALLGALSFGLAACSQKTPEERLEEAVLMLQQGQVARAVLELRTIVRESPGDPASAQARMYLAQYYAREGNAARAIEELQAVYEQYGRDGELGSEAGDALIGIRSQIGDLEGALKLADEAIASIGEDDEERRGEYKLLRATILIDQDEDDSKEQGLAELKRLMLESNAPWQRGQAREMLANLHRADGDFEGSNAVYTEYLEAFPDDRIRSRLELAMAVNKISGGDEEVGRAEFDAAAARMMAEAEEELDREAKTQMLQELAAFYQSIDDLAGAETVMLKIMAENAMSMTAIHTQFAIAQMYINSGIFEEREAHFDRGLEILEQIQRENPNSNIAMDAEAYTTQAKEVRENYRAHLAAQASQADETTDEGTEPAMDDATLEGMSLETPALTTAP